MYRSKRRLTKRPRRALRKVHKKRPVSKSVKQYVKRTISAKAEDKQMMLSYFVGPALTPGASGAIPAVMDLTPLIVQGVGKGQRVGSQCRMKTAYLNWRWTISGASQTSAVDMPLFCYMMIARPRSSQNNVTVTDTDQLFYNGGGTLTQFDSGDAQANWFIPNKDYWDIRYWTRKPIKLGSATGSGTTLFANNDFKADVSGVINMAKIYGKLWRFNNSGSVPLGQNWYLLAFVQKYDYTTTTLNWDPPVLAVQLNVKYEDE